MNHFSSLWFGLCLGVDQFTFSGLSWVDHTFKLENFEPRNIQNNDIGKILETAEPKYLKFRDKQLGYERPAREYSPIIRDLICQEILRRVDLKKRTLGRFLKEEISSPFKLDIHLGISDDSVMKRVSRVEIDKPTEVVKNSITEKIGTLAEGLSIEKLFSGLANMCYTAIEFCYACNFLIGQANLSRFKYAKYTKDILWRPNVMDTEGLPMSVILNDPKVYKVEIPSANVVGSARSLAKLAAILANGGTLDDKCLLSKKIWSKFHENPEIQGDILLGALRTAFTDGGLNFFQDYKDDTRGESMFKKGKNGYHGWIGLSGSVFQWNPGKKIGFAYTPSWLRWQDFSDNHGGELQEEVLKCINKLTKL